MSKLVFGCGYLGLRVARKWLAAGHRVHAVTRWPQRATQLRHEGLDPIVWNLTEPEPVKLPAAETVLFSVGFDRAAGGKTIGQVYADGLQAALDHLPNTASRFLYISSTGVYSQDDGSWVDELSPAQPLREGGRACLEAERRLADHPAGQNRVVLRLAGLYGPGRIPRRREIERGHPLATPDKGYLNLIHVLDAAEVVLAAEAKASLPLYLVSDGTPVVRGDYFRYLAQRFNAPEPTFIPPPPDSPVAQRAASNKRISNRRMREELYEQLMFLSYREGLDFALALGHC